MPEGIDGVRQMISVADSDSQQALVAMCGLCGLRISEALSIRPSNFDFQQLSLTVRGKGDVTRILPVSDSAWEAMFPAVSRAFLTGYDPTVVGFKDRFARGLITTLGHRANLSRRVASHDLRATFATEVYRLTQDKMLVQRLLGHANGTTTEVYIEVAMQSMRSAVNKL